MDTHFKPNNYFDLSEFTHRDLFDGVEHVWEIVPKISEYIQMMFDSGKLKPNYKNSTNIFIGENTFIEEGAFIKGPAIIGKNCYIGHVAYLRENCLFGDNVHIGHASEIKNSVFLNKSKSAHLNYVADSIVGNNVNIAGGAMFANFRLDKKHVTVRKNDSIHNTNLFKFGSAVGDNSSIGAGVVINPGTMLGINTVVYPLVSVRGVHKNGEVVK